ncbi:hypothetical protein DICVIV_06899 [Dictyocaulus viviparus]|uniref:Uncharacterized protein n=1 Tax=Dictyocaulus viviparus TaxID=29172 RepID=A0A0D8XT65_DICVI|nr:hypothetical protein DICVIV_06899 [Dictyocaulus viviparus]
MLPSSCSSPFGSHSSEVRGCVKKAQRDAMVDLVTSTIDMFLSRSCDEPQVLSIRVPDVNVTVAEVTPTEASKMVNNPHYDKLLEAAENKKRVHAACAAARQFLVEHSMAKNPFCPSAHKTHGVAAIQPKNDKVDLTFKDSKGKIRRRQAANVLRPGGLLSSTNTSSSHVSTSSNILKVARPTSSSYSKSSRSSSKSSDKKTKSLDRSTKSSEKSSKSLGRSSKSSEKTSKSLGKKDRQQNGK